jgi:ABC-type lipoprotein export system ATPase subunit
MNAPDPITSPVSLELEGLEVYFDQGLPPENGRSDDGAGDQRFHMRIPSLKVQGGEMIGIAGRSGEGKSTLLHVLALLYRPPKLKRLCYRYVAGGKQHEFVYSQPECKVADVELERVRNEAFGFIFQQHFLLPYFNVRDNVTLPVMVRPGYHRQAFAGKTDQLLDQLGLNEIQRAKRPSQLSGGQNQRVAVARALLHQPPFLFADEPTANLDRHKREQVLRNLRAAADSGQCVILVSHELGDLAHYCDRVLMVQDNHLEDPFAGQSADPSRPVLPKLEKQDGCSKPRTKEDAGMITGFLSGLIWPANSSATNPAPLEMSQTPTASGSARRSLGFRSNAWKYAASEVFSRKQALMRVLVAMLLFAATLAFSFLSDLGQGSLRYLTESTLNKPSEYLNRIVVRRKDAVNRLKPEHVQFLSEQVPGLKAPVTFRQKEYRFQVYTEKGLREDKYGPYSVPNGDDTIQTVKPEDRETAQIGLVYRKGGPFLPGQADRAGVLVSRRFLRQTYWRLGDKVDDPEVPDPEYPETLEFRMTIAEGGSDEEEFRGRFLPGINGRIQVPVVGVFEYPTLVVKNQTNGEQALPQVYFPEDFLRRFGVPDGKPAWDWYFAFLIKRCGEGDVPLQASYEVIRSLTISIDGGSRPEGWLREDLADGRSDLVRGLKRTFGTSIDPLFDQGRILLKFDKAREQGRQKLTREKLDFFFDRDLRSILSKASMGGEPKIASVELQPVSNLFPSATLPVLSASDPIYVDAILRLKSFRDVLPARHVVEQKYDEDLEIEPKGAQVVALERFESINGIMEYGYFALQVTFIISLTFIIGITAYMHIMSKTSDIGILRSYGLSPRSIAWVYAIELSMLILPACLLGILAAWGAAHHANDWIAETVVLTAGPTDTAEADPLKTRERPRVFLSLQQGLAANAIESGKTLGLTIVVLTVITALTVWLIKRQQIVDSLRAGAG